MKRAVSLGDSLRYRFENTLSAGPIAIIGWLAVVSLAIVLVAALAIVILRVSFGDPDAGGDAAQPTGFIEAAWNLLMRTFDAGNMADDKGWPLRIVTLLVTLGGIFIVSTLIGTITSGMESSIEELRKGRSRVIESGHTLILGWSPKVFAILNELVIANENQRSPRIVIMADHDKVDMEDEVRSKLPNTRNTRVICRRGSPLDLDDLELVNPHEAKSVIILSPEVNNPDTYVIKSILALTNNPNRSPEPFHIVAEILDPRNMEAAELVGGEEAVLILSADVIARITAQTCRQSGLSVVYQELMDFDGAEIYFKEEPSLLGKTYREALSCFQTSTMMGLFTADKQALVNPPMDRVIAKGDQVIVISEDDDTVEVAPPPANVSLDAVRQAPAAPPTAERTLVLGWNAKGEQIVRELDAYVAAGSEVVIVAEAEAVGHVVQRLNPELQRQSVRFVAGDTTERAALAAIQPASFNHIILLSDTNMEVQEADAKTLITLLHLRKLSQETGQRFAIVSEMLDVRNRALAEVAQPDDFIVSDKLISLMFSQISENKHLEHVLKDLFDPEGSEIYLKPITNYVTPDHAVDFYTLVAAAAQRGDTAIGYRIQALSNASDRGYGVVINPDKKNTVTFTPQDKLVVLAED
jgi:voltage-gated potassium channel Kch